MACRIGMTTDMDERKKYWKNQHSNLHNWRMLGEYRSKTAAQNAERRFATQYGCESHPGGSGNEQATWYVYKFNY